MKVLKIAVFVTIALIALACTQTKPVDYTLISGKLENFNGGELVVMGTDRSEIKIAVAEDGTFADTIKKEGNFYLVLGNSSTKIYAINGARLNITGNAENLFESAEITGDKSEMSAYLQAKNKVEKAAQAQMKELYAKNEADFMAAGKENLAKQEAELVKFTEIPEELKSLEKRALKAAYIGSLINYPRYHSYFAKVENYEASEEFLNAAKDFNYNDGELYEYSQDYQRMLMVESYNKAAKLVESGEASSNVIGNLMVAEKYENEIIREALLFSAVANSFARAENAKELYNRYMALAKSEEKRAQVTERYNAVAKLLKGQQSPKFFNYENYAGGTSSLDDFNGKYVYIDVWATWCGPCKAEIPHLQRVEEKYHGKNIEFVSISCDKEKDKETWRKMVADKQMGGVQLITHERDFMDAYVISGIPRFILIDPQGNIVTKNAPRPSDPKLISLFNELEI